MRSTFYGYEIARSAINASQAGLDVTGQNMANTKTKGYTRQTVNQSEANYNVNNNKYAPSASQAIGEGVKIDSIGQIRDDFLDIRYRNAYSEDSYNSEMLSVLSDINGVLDENNVDGLNKTLSNFYSQLQTYSGKPGQEDIAGTLRSSAQKVTSTLNQYAAQLKEANDQELYELGVGVDDLNGILSKIESVNNTIKNEKVQGNSTNELLDKRNNYIDDLSKYVNISVEKNEDGTVSIKTGSKYLVDAENDKHATLSLDKSGSDIKILDESGNALALTSGSLAGGIKLLNGKGSYAAAGEENYRGIKYYQQALDDFTAKFAKTFNDLNGKDVSGNAKPLFDGTTASTIKVSAGWTNDATYVVKTGDEALKLVDAMKVPQTISSYYTGTFAEFASSIMGEAATDKGYVSGQEDKSGLQATSIENQRESVSGVSLNDETVNMMQYQKSFEAASRIMTAIDEMLNVIINKMGVS